MIIDGQTVEINDIIEFRSINPKDANLYQGTVISLATFDVAKIYTDVVKYHQEVLESNPTVEEDPTVLDYFIVKCSAGGTIINWQTGEEETISTPITNAFAVDWVQSASLNIIDALNIIKVWIYGTPDTEAENIIKLLRDNDHRAKLIVD